MKFDIRIFFVHLWRKFKFHYKLTKITGTLHEYPCPFMTVSRWITLILRNVLETSLEKIKTHILWPITFFPHKSFRLWNNVDKHCKTRQATDDNIIRRMRFACWITKVTDTYSEYVIIIAFPHQQWLHADAPMLRWYVHCIFCLSRSNIPTQA
jgi:hypothetical protein